VVASASEGGLEALQCLIDNDEDIQGKTAGSCATVRTGLWWHPDALQCLIDNDEDIWTSEQNRLDASSIMIKHGVGFQKSTLFGKSLQAVRTTWQHVRTMSSISEYSRVSFERRKDFSEDRPDARSSFGSELDKNRITLFLKGYRRKPSGRG